MAQRWKKLYILIKIIHTYNIEYEPGAYHKDAISARRYTKKKIWSSFINHLPHCERREKKRSIGNNMVIGKIFWQPDRGNSSDDDERHGVGSLCVGQIGQRNRYIIHMWRLSIAVIKIDRFGCALALHKKKRDNTFVQRLNFQYAFFSPTSAYFVRNYIRICSSIWCSIFQKLIDQTVIFLINFLKWLTACVNNLFRCWKERLWIFFAACAADDLIR